MGKITYNDKVALITNPDIADENKVTDNDMNEIKQVVNENDDKFLTNGLNVSNEVDEDYRVNLLEGNNLFKGFLFIGIINEGGDYSSVNTRITNANSSTMKTFILPAGTYTFDCEGLDYCAILTKNESGTRIDDFADSWKALPFTFTTTQDAYIYISARKSDNSVLNPNDYSFILQEGSTIKPIQYNQIVVDNEKYSDTLNVGVSVDSRSRVNVLYSKNLFTNSNLTNGFINPDGTITTNTDFRVSDYINVSDMSKITISGNSGGSEKIGFYNSSKTFISTVNTSTNTTMTIDVPNNATYVRATIRATNLNIYTIQEGSSAITPSIYVDNEMLVSKNVYSTEEVVIGEWLGKPLYRKVVEITNPTLDAWASVNHNIANMDFCRIVDANITRTVYGTTSYIPIGVSNISAGTLFICDLQKTIFEYKIAGYANITKLIAVLEYTKTTD